MESEAQLTMIKAFNPELEIVQDPEIITQLETKPEEIQVIEIIKEKQPAIQKGAILENQLAMQKSEIINNKNSNGKRGRKNRS